MGNFPTRSEGCLLLGTVFSNCGFMGFPVVASIYGKIGSCTPLIFVVVFSDLIWTIRVGPFFGRQGLGKLAKALINPESSPDNRRHPRFLPFDLPVFMSEPSVSCPI
jgi:hypothetical protein